VTAVVITPTTGLPVLADAIKSVAAQTEKVEHWIIVDGMEHAQKALEICQANDLGQKLIVLPENTGRPVRHHLGENRKYNGHRIYGAMSFLVNHDHVFLLDEDNWYEPNHCETMLQNMRMLGTRWCYSLRNIMDMDGNFLHKDDCDSLGVYPNWVRTPFVDMNCYCFEAGLYADIAPWFYGELHADKTIFQVAVAKMERHYQFCSTGMYTVNYRARPDVIEGWFKPGMEKIKLTYGDSKPWAI
jgi:glycosyltransferase involved in cell wall biosynthesis